MVLDMALAWCFLLAVALSTLPGILTEDCGLDTELVASQGEIQSENYPNTFPGNSCKLWFIRGQPGYVITISFATLSLPKDSYSDYNNCSQNFIQIGPLPQFTICGSSKEPYIKRFDHTHSFVWIKFKSGSRPKGRGFRLQYMIGPEPASYCPDDQFRCDNGKCVMRQWCHNGQNECGDFSDESPSCHRDISQNVTTALPAPTTPTPARCRHHLDSVQGNFSMPPGPLYRWSDVRDCSWLIHSPDPSSQVILKFDQFHLRLGERIQVFDGDSENARRLGYLTSAKEFLSTGNRMLVVFKASPYSERTDRPGRIIFSAAYQGVMSTVATPSPTGKPHSECKHILRQSRGNFSMPPAPQFFRGDIQNCTWLIETEDSDFHVRLTFTEFDLTGAASVQVFDGPASHWPRVALFKKEHTSRETDPIQSSGSSMFIVFTRPEDHTSTDLPEYEYDYFHTGIMFKASYIFSTGYLPETTTRLPRGQFHLLTASQGNFSMPPAPTYLTANIQDCSWLIRAPDSSKHIRLTFSTLDLRGRERIDVYDGASEESPRLVTPLTKFQHVRSTGNHMLVKFFAGYSKPHTDTWIVFSATYYAERESDICVNSQYKHCGAEDNYACYHVLKRCDGVWDCPLSGADEAGCFGCSPTSYSCAQFGGLQKCYFKRDRCNGGSACENHRDEDDCNEQQCTAGRDLFLCENKRCILSGWLCDGTDDCGDNSDEKGCRIGSSRRVIIAAVVGSLICSLLLVMALGCACKVYSLRNQQHRRSHRFDTPLSRLQAEMFRRRAPPPPYHEAMLTSRPYDEAVREYLARTQNTQPPAHSERGGGQPASEQGEGQEEGEHRSVQNLINLMDLSEEGAANSGDHPPPFSDASLHLELRSSDASSDSNYDDDDDDEDDDDSGNLAEDESGHIEMEATGSSRSRRSEGVDGTAVENVSEDSASAILSTDGMEPPKADSSGSGTGKDPDLDQGSRMSKEKSEGMGDKKEEESDTDSVCILCLDDPPLDDLDDSDTRCLLQDV